jgi:hypothetical protein
MGISILAWLLSLDPYWPETESSALHFEHDVTLLVAVLSFALFILLTLGCFPRITMI